MAMQKSIFDEFVAKPGPILTTTPPATKGSIFDEFAAAPFADDMSDTATITPDKRSKEGKEKSLAAGTSGTGRMDSAFYDDNGVFMGILPALSHAQTRNRVERLQSGGMKGRVEENKKNYDPSLPDWSMGKAFSGGVSDTLGQVGSVVGMNTNEILSARDKDMTAVAASPYLTQVEKAAILRSKSAQAPGLLQGLMAQREGVQKAALSWKEYFDPGRYNMPTGAGGQLVHDITRAMPYTLASMAVNIPTAVASGGSSMLASLLSASPEAQMEQAGVYDEMRRRGMGHEEAYAASQKVLAANMALLPASNYLQQLVSLRMANAVHAAEAGAPLDSITGRMVGRAMAGERLGKVMKSDAARAGAATLLDITAEGGEEASQGYITTKALGEPVDARALAYEGAVGGVMGALFGGASALTNRAVNGRVTVKGKAISDVDSFMNGIADDVSSDADDAVLTSGEPSSEARKFVPNTAILNEMRNFYKEIRAVPEAQRSAEDIESFAALRNVLELYSSGREQEAEAMAKERFDTSKLERSIETAPIEMKERATAELAVPAEREAPTDESMSLLSAIRERFVEDFRRYGDVEMDSLSGDERYHAALVRAAGDAYQQGDFQRVVNILAHLYGTSTVDADAAPIVGRERATSELAVPGWRMEKIEPPKAPASAGPRYVEVSFPQRRRGEVAAEMAKMTKDAIGRKYGMDAAEMAAKRGTMAAADAVARQTSQNGRMAAGSETTPPLNAVHDAQSPAIQKQGQVDGDKAAAADENYPVGYTYQDRGWGYDKDGLRFDDGIVTKKVTSVKDGQFHVEQDGVGGADIFDAERMKNEVEASAPARVKAFHTDRMSEAQAVEQKDAEGLAKRERERVNGFTDGMSDMRRGQVNKALDKQFRYDGRAMSRREYVEDAAAKDGAHVYKGGRNGDYRLYEQDGERGTFTQITKTEYDYFNHLRGKGAKSEVAAELEAARKEAPVEMPAEPAVSDPVANENMQEGPGIPDAKAVASESVEGVAYPGGEHKYYLNARPAGPGAVPKGITRIDNEDKGGRHGAVYYDHKLSAKDVSDYELVPAKDGGDNQKKDEPVNNEMGPDENVKPEAEEVKPAELSAFAVAKKSPAWHISEKQRTAAGKSVQAAAKKASDMQGYYTDEAGRQVFTDARAVFRLSKQVEGLEAAGANASSSAKVASLFEHVKKEESVTLGREEIAEIVARGKRPRGKKAAEVPEFITKVGQAYVDSTRLGDVLSVLGADEVTVYTSKPRADESGRGYYYSNVYFTSENGEALLAPVNLRDAGARAVDAYYKGVSTSVHEKTTANESQKKGNGGVSQEQPSVGKPAEKITDFGEKIGGARKDFAALYRQSMEAKYSDEDVAKRPLSEVFPAPDYDKMVESGADKRSMAIVRALRDAIPAKPRDSFKMPGYVRAVKSAREIASKIMSDPDYASEAMARMGQVSTTQRGILDKAALYEEMGHGASLKNYSIRSVITSEANGKKFEKPTRVWMVRKSGRTVAYGESLSEAAGALREYLAKDGAPQDGKPDYAVYIQRSSGKDGYYVGEKVGRDYAELAGPFAKLSEADAYMRDHTEELARKLNNFKATPSERREVNAPRIGADMRGGRDVTPEMFSSAFGFRGVEFGNWVEQGKRQADLNEAYDSLMDLAAIIGVPPKALSLNGKLGLAFGARGKGGKDPAKAHYEPDNVAINLTKAHGAGSLAHEWMHAVDDYFAKAGGKRDKISGSSEVYTASKGREPKDIPGVRPEMVKAFGEVRRAITESEMPKRSAELDKRRSKPYWATETELQSRAFEAYIAEKLAVDGASNDYLVNIVSEEYWQAQNALLEKEGQDDFPYPKAGEMPAVSRAFDNFFKTVKTRETDKGVEMYRLAPTARAQLDADTAAFGKQVDEFVAGKMGRYTELKVMQTPLVLQISDARVKPLQIVMSQNTLKKIFTKHRLSPNLVKQIPWALADPIMVLESEGKAKQLQDGMVVMLEMKDAHGATINVPIALNTVHKGAHGQIICNDIASIYGRMSDQTGKPFDEWFVRQAIAPGRLKYVNTEKISQWISQAGLVGSGGQSIKSLFNSVKTEADLVKAQDDAPGTYALGKGQNGLPPLSVSDVAARVKGATVTDLGEGKMKLEFASGAVWIVDAQAGEVAADPEVVTRDYGREVRPGEAVVGRTRVIDGQRFIEMVAGMSDGQTFSHEIFEAAWDSLTKEEQATVLKTHGSREKAAERYGEFLEGRVGKLTKRTQAVFQRVKDFFSAIRAALFGKNSEDVFREVASGKVLNRAPGVVANHERYRLAVRTQEQAQKGERSQVAPDTSVAAEKDAQWLRDMGTAELERVVRPSRQDESLKDKLAHVKSNFYRQWFDRLNPIKKHFGDNIFFDAENAIYGAASRAERRFEKGDPENGVKGLVEIMAQVSASEQQGFAAYAVYKHLNDLATNGEKLLRAAAELEEAAKAKRREIAEDRRLPSPDKDTLAEWKRRVAVMQAEYDLCLTQAQALREAVKFTKSGAAQYASAVRKIEEHYPHWKKPQRELVKYNRALLEMIMDSGMISDEMYSRLTDLYPNYVPLQRDFGADERSVGGFVGGMGLVNIQSPLKRLKGSARDVIDPLEQVVRNTFQFESAAARQSVGRQIMEEYDNGNFKGLMEEVENRHHASDEMVWHVWDKGKKRLFRSERDIYEALMPRARAKWEDNPVVAASRFITSVLRKGTTHGLTFALRNPVRDTFSYAIVGENFRPVVDTMRGLMMCFDKRAGSVYDEFMQHGGAQGMTVLTKNEHAERMKQLRHEKGTVLLDWNSLKNPPKAVYDLIGMFSEYGELASRLGQFERAKAAGYSTDEAANITRDNMNFMRMGTLGEQANQHVGFFNAAIQGMDKMFRTYFKGGKVDKKALLRSLMYITIPSMLQMLYNFDDDDRRKRYKNLPAWRKNTFWNFVIGKDGPIVSIPKPFEIGMIFGSLPERVMEYAYTRNKRVFDGVGTSMLSSLTPEFYPNALMLVAEVKSNHSFFYQRPIVSEREKRFEPALQYGPYTAEWAKAAGNALNISPRLLEYVAFSLGGGLAKETSNVSDALVRMVTKETRPERPWYETAPGARGFFSGEGDAIESAFQSEIQILNRKRATAEEILKTEGPNALSSAQKRILQAAPDIKAVSRLNNGKGGLYEAFRAIREITTAKNLSAADKRVRIKRIEDNIRDASERGLARIDKINEWLDR